MVLNIEDIRGATYIKKLSLDEISLKNNNYNTVVYYWVTLRWKITLHISVMTISNEHYGIHLCSTLVFIILRGLKILKSIKTYLDVKKY